MKKGIRLFLCVMAIFMLVGCGDAKNNDQSKDNTTTTTTTTTTEKADGLEKFVEDNKSAVEKLSNSMFDATIIARDNNLVYVYTYKETYDNEVLGSMKEPLEESLKKQKEAFNSALESVRLVAPDTKAVIVEYYNGNKTLITSVEFK